MTPKEKAEQLIEKYKPLVATWDCYWDSPRNEDGIIEDAKKCALICVDEITRLNCFLYPQQEIVLNNEYWNKVKDFLIKDNSI